MLMLTNPWYRKRAYMTRKDVELVDVTQVKFLQYSSRVNIEVVYCDIVE